MRITVERLRLGILLATGALLVGVLLFFVYARWQVRRIERDLPAKLGVEIQQSSKGFTFSKSQGGRTLFTLHAAKTVQFKQGGRASLHDVSITLYGTTGGLTDHIYGDDFDYDPVGGIVRADGSVQIDLEVPGGPGPEGADAGSPNKSTVHVKTSGLVFNEKTGMASTAQKFVFSLPQGQGSAVGASFNSTTGVLILDSDVALDSNLDGTPLSVRARHAQYNRASQLLYLLNDETEYEHNRGSSDQATVHFRPDGSASQILSQGHVTILGSEGQRITSQVARTSLDAKSQPQQVKLEGGLLYTADDALRQVHGAAATGTLFFGPGATLERARLETAVSIVDQEKPRPQSSGQGAPAGRSYLSSSQEARAVQEVVREARAGQVDIDFLAGPVRRPVAQHILATGAASIDIRTLYAAAPPEETSVEADRLLANLQDGVALSSLQGAGHTKLTMVGEDGSKQTSTGDALSLAFASPPPKTRKPAQARQAASLSARATSAGRPEEAAHLQSQLQSLDQTGHVTVVQTSPAQPPAPSRVITATAERATYNAATQIVRLYGSPQQGNPRIHEPDGDLTAETIEFARATGDLTAAGHVQATYRQLPGQPGVSFGNAQPVHVVADRAHGERSADLVTFYGYGDSGADARLWQGADSISAPVIELARERRTLDAHGSAEGSKAQAVTAVFASAAFGPATQPGSTANRSEVSLIRVGSRRLFYSGVDNKAVFDGGVTAQVPSGSLRSSAMDVYLAGSAPSGQSGANRQPKQNQAQQVERIVARGAVQLEQPGRKATGSQLVYTAADSRYVLTGSSSQPPRLTDQVRGTVTGSSLIFNDRDDSVIVSGGPSKAVTETRTAR